MIINLMKKLFRFVFNKLFWVLLAVILQLATVLVLLMSFQNGRYIFTALMFIVKIIFMVEIVNSETAPEYKNVWLVTLLISTYVGVVLYFYFGRVKMSPSMKKKRLQLEEKLAERSMKYPNVTTGDKIADNIAKYISKSCSSAAFEKNHVEYFSVGEAFFEKLFAELEKANKYIYLDYFIICGGKIWDRLFDILERKIKDGVEVKLMYDDFGSVLKIDRDFSKRLAESGIKVKAFNRLSTALTSKQNYRDHRKVCVIDGVTCFVGGINLSDEYANITSPFGHWKDTAVMIKGSAADVYENEFLANFDWSLENYLPEKTTVELTYDEKGYVVPYFDSPLEKIQICRDVFEDLISGSEESVCITTPYFVVDYSIENALKNALKRGVKVTVIIPGIYDKWYVREISRMYASRLEKYGAEIYEYKPGFLHQKMMVVDGKYAVTGSSNLDFRSFYLSFESGVFMYDTPVIKEMCEDFDAMVSKSEFFREEKGSIGLFRWIFRHTFSVFSPLM